MGREPGKSNRTSNSENRFSVWLFFTAIATAFV
jgi:hypothetical protein